MTAFVAATAYAAIGDVNSSLMTSSTGLLRALVADAARLRRFKRHSGDRRGSRGVERRRETAWACPALGVQGCIKL